MENIKEIGIKNRSYYFFDDMVKIQDFNANSKICKLKIDKKVIPKHWYLLHWIYHKKRS